MEDLCFPLPSEGLEVLKCEETRSALFFAIQEKFGCSIEFENLEQAAASSFGTGKAKITPEIKYTKQLSNGVSISVWKDDLTTHKVDAVVNAANNGLSHGAGLALALSEAGGPEINRTSQEIIRKQGKVETGDAVLAPSGNLPCKKIIHAVGPCLPSRTSRKEIDDASVLLKKAILQILILTDKHNLQSVAIPAISSGIFHFPLQFCAEIIVKTVKSFSPKSRHNKMEVRLVNNDDPSVCAMERACKEFLGASDFLQMSVAVQNHSQGSTQSVLSTLDLGNVTLILKKGAIQDEVTEVIVNSTGPDVKLSVGFVSKALLEKAGNGMQQELNKKTCHSFVSFGDVFETSGYNLGCKTVFHSVCARKNDTDGVKILKSVIGKCLKKACDKGFSSISFPAIGTGNLGFPKDEVAQIMIKAIMDFAQSHKNKKMKIYFVIFPTDTEAITAFERNMAFSQNVPDTAVLSSTKSKSQVSQGSVVGGKTPRIRFFGNSKEAQREAQLWSHNILLRTSNRVEISNNHVAYLDQDDHAKLTTIQAKFNVLITEFFKEGRSGMIINGESVDVSQAALEVEALLCKAQEQFALTEEKEINRWHPSGSKEGSGRRSIDPKSHEYKNIVDKFKTSGLLVEKVEEINNPALRRIFEFNEKRLGSKVKTLYQRVNAQFCNLICKVGFQREYAPPKEQKYGAGIYFTTNVKEARSLWTDSEEAYVYIIEARVLIGKYTSGSPGLILPPPIGRDPLNRYDSVSDIIGEIFVLFNGQQALPERIITCRQTKNTGV